MGEEKERKTETNNLKMKYDSKTALMSEEIMSLKSQVSKYKRDRDSYKEMAEPVPQMRTLIGNALMILHIKCKFWEMSLLILNYNAQKSMLMLWHKNQITKLRLLN